MTEPKEALKPCPFCGGEAESNPRTYADAEADVGNTYINCIRCGIETPWRLTEAKAIAAWNTRAEADENAALREKLAERDALLRDTINAAANVAYVTCAKERHVTLGDKVRDEIQALTLTGGDNAQR